MEEIYKQIEFGNGQYFISNTGKVKRVINGKERILKNTETYYGYFVVGICGKQYKVHRLMALAFIDNPNDYKQINHINGIKTDNRIENLEWCTAKYNMIHKYKAGLYKHSEETKRQISITRRNTEMGIVTPKAKKEYKRKREFNNIIKCVPLSNRMIRYYEKEKILMEKRKAKLLKQLSKNKPKKFILKLRLKDNNEILPYLEIKNEFIKQLTINEMNEKLKNQLIEKGITSYYRLAKETMISPTSARVFWIGGNSTSKTLEIIRRKYGIKN